VTPSAQISQMSGSAPVHPVVGGTEGGGGTTVVDGHGYVNTHCPPSSTYCGIV
jgi:hypothetical protein